MRAGLKGDYEKARRLHFQLMPTMRACFFETNPIPAKTMLAAMGLIEPTLRLPLVPMTEGNRHRMLAAFEGLVEGRVV